MREKLFKLDIKKDWKVILGFVLIIVNVLLSAFWLFRGEIHYDIDISRDFLVMSEAVANRKPFLIGPHSGVIAGVFHGPLWYYLNLPAFILSRGNPLAMGWFWWLLSLGAVVLIGWVAKRLFNSKVALLAMVLYSANSIINPMDNLKQFFNPYGAVVLFPLFYYFLVGYLKNKKVYFLLASLFVAGLIIQFQMAFGGPILLVTFLYLFNFFYKNKLFKHIFSFLILLIPLSTFILFDVRHDFLQLRSLVAYFLSANTGTISFRAFIFNRLKAVVTDVYLMLTPKCVFLAVLTFAIFLFSIFKYKLIKKVEYSLFIYLYFAFWLFLFIFKGWTGNYYWPFLPMVIILISSFLNFIPKKIFTVFYLVLVVWNIYIGVLAINGFSKDVTRRGINSWAYNKLLAESVFNDANSDFGFYIFTPDRWVFNQKYALEYVDKHIPDKKAFASEKKPLTYLIIVDPPMGRPDIDPLGWKLNDIKITSESVARWKIDVTTIEKYILTEEEMSIPHNPYLLDSTFFR
jgi:hypothetical protein